MAKKRAPPKGCYWRNKTLWGRVQVNGQEHRWSLDTSDFELAKRRFEKGKEDRIADIKHGDAKRSLVEAIIEWQGNLAGQVRDGLIGQNTEIRYLCSLKQLAPFLEGKDLTEIDLRLLNEIVAGRQKQGVSNATVKRDLVALSSLMNYCLDQTYVESNPVLVKLRRVKEAHRPIRLPRPEHIEFALQCAPGGMLADMARAAKVTGARLDEIATLRRHQIDHARKQATIIGKGRRQRTIELDVMGAYEMLVALPAYAGSDYVFWHDAGEPYRNASSNFANNVVGAAEVRAKELGVDFRAYRFHDLRHVYAVTYLKDGWGTIYDLQKQLGHASIKTTERYLSGEFLTEAEIQAAKYGPSRPLWEAV